MNFTILASLIVLSIALMVAIKRQAKKADSIDRDFWDREARSNMVRKKSLDNLDYINIPLEQFPTNLLNDDAEVMDYIDVLSELTGKKIVNFSGFSNTDLKLEYGAGNLPELSEYDSNYTVMVRTIQAWADRLLSAGYGKEASLLMEYAISTGTDITATYDKLADYYFEKKEFGDIDKLIYRAELLKSPNKKIILKHLKDNYPQL
ncbi:MAG: hypothetical protein J6033_04545 [Lachnospiraceae bacterium]|nr:hypothetical protein [Lachnospiraceae bacterium]